MYVAGGHHVKSVLPVEHYRLIVKVQRCGQMERHIGEDDHVFSAGKICVH